MDFVGAASLQRVQFISQRRSEVHVRARLWAAAVRAEIRQDGVDAVDTRARHQPHKKLGCHFRSFPARATRKFQPLLRNRLLPDCGPVRFVAVSGSDYSAPASVAPCPTASCAESTATLLR